jgi:hypothetical protein
VLLARPRVNNPLGCVPYAPAHAVVSPPAREDLLARLATSFAGGAPPDVFLLNYRF